MKHDLAKELKNAGFTQGGEGQWHMLSGVYSYAETRQKWADGAEKTYIPTLSDLIEAVGDKLGELVSPASVYGDGKYWQCRMTNPGLKIRPSATKGGTPEEAVARLWLALNKKP